MKQKILMVDDDKAICIIIRQAFVDDFEVLIANDGEAALGILRSDKPALVLLDIRMPGMSGLEVLRQIKVEALSTPVWMLTAEEDMATAMQALDLGAAGYQTKPFSIDRIREIVHSSLADSAPGKHHTGDKPWTVKRTEN